MASIKDSKEGRQFELKVAVKHGISYLPEACQAYKAGYRFGAYRQTADGETHVVEFFKTQAEIQTFVNDNPQYGSKNKL